MKVSAEIHISAPIAKVFEVFSDLEHAAERITGITAIEVLEGQARMAVGTKWRETRTMFGKEATEVMWVTALTPLRGYVVEANSHGMYYRSEYTFTEKSGDTQVHMTFAGTPQTFVAKVFNKLFSWMAGSMEKMLYQDMKDLKKICEEIV